MMNLFLIFFCKLKHTDICRHAIEALRKSQVKRVILLGRRGPLEVSFTIKELREMIRLEDTKPLMKAEDFVDIRPKVPGMEIIHPIMYAGIIILYLIWFRVSKKE